MGRVTHFLLIFAVIGLAVLCEPAQTYAQVEREYYQTLTSDQRALIQLLLIWTGDYQGTVDADFGPLTLAAIRSFESRNGFVVDGLLEEAAIERLFEDGAEEITRAGFEIVTDPGTGAEIGLPLAYIAGSETSQFGTTYYSADRRLVVDTYSLPAPEFTLAALYAAIQATEGVIVFYQTYRDGWFVINGRQNGRRFYSYFQSSPNQLRGFWIEYDPVQGPLLDRVAVAMFNVFEGFPVGGGNIAAAPTPQAPNPGQTNRAPVEQSGTGFAVADGVVLTNAHVVADCGVATVGFVTTTRIVRDERNDMALLFVGDAVDLSPLSFAASPTRLGEDVFAFGFPLRHLLADSLNVTQGLVSSLVGLGGDTRYIQITAPIQPGNSGGPLIDRGGLVVGMVSAKLNALAVAAETGDIPEGVNFALRREAIMAFLSANGVEVSVSVSTGPLDATQIVEQVRDSIFPVVCTTGSASPPSVPPLPVPDATNEAVPLPIRAPAEPGHVAAEPPATPRVMFSVTQANWGELQYGIECATCHGDDLTGDRDGPALVGGAFTAAWVNRPVSDLTTAMRDGSLHPGDAVTDEDYAAIVAFILRENGFQPGNVALPSDHQQQALLIIAGIPQSDGAATEDALPSTPVSQGIYLQVSAQPTEAAARATLLETINRAPSILADQPTAILRAALPQGTYYRVMFGPYSVVADAEALRQRLAAVGIDSFIQTY